MKNSVVSVYHLPKTLLELLSKNETISKLGYVGWGVSSSDNNRFLRLWWEVSSTNKRWVPHVKGGGYCKWQGLDFWAVEWRDSGIAIKSFILERYPYLGENAEIKVRSYTANSPGWTFSSMVGKGLAVRKLYTYQTTNAKSPALFLDHDQPFIGGFLNATVSTFILQGLTPSLNVDEGYIAALPIKYDETLIMDALVEGALALKELVISRNIIERRHVTTREVIGSYSAEALLHLIEGVINSIVVESFSLSEQDIQQIRNEIGTPAGWYPLIAGYDLLPSFVNPQELPQTLLDYFTAHKRVLPNEEDLAHIKTKLKMLYKAGPKAKEIEQEEHTSNVEESEQDITPESYVSMPTETFLEELSVKMELHPISVYWLLEEFRQDKVRCKPEEKRLLEDRLSVLVLRLLGHHWPKQLEAGEIIPTWADEHGIIPLVPGTGKPMLAERIRERLRIEDGALATQQTEALLQELAGQNLEQWLRQSFFTNHMRQFKHRPIAWHLASKPVKSTKPAGNKKSKRGSVTPSSRPAFECLLYYHAIPKGALTRIRVQYIEPLLNAERNKAEQQGKTSSTTLFKDEASFERDDTEAAIAKLRIQELEDFAERLQRIEEEGFACSELQELLANEPLDIWDGDGHKSPSSYDEFRRSEEAWRVDINDGVRVNIAPLQLAGVLATEVLKPADAKKAISDRARWRSDERRWVRDGKLPRCGWMDEHVPASKEWLENEKTRNAELSKVKPQQLDWTQEGLGV